MAAPQFVVTFRGGEVGRYETADRAMAAARSVIDAEVASRIGAGDREPGELPRIEWQPPRVPFPFDAVAYWRQRTQSQPRDVEPAPSAPPTAAQTSKISLQDLGIAGEESRPLRRQDRLQSDRPPAPVQSGPPPQRPVQQPQPVQQAQPAPPRRPAQPQQPVPPPQPVPMHGDPQRVSPAPPPLPPMPDDPHWAPQNPQPEQEPQHGKRRWFGKKRDRSE
ncbi:hypothetical protein A9W99_17230 [Mycobacterium sp. 1164966.3]|uniref:hypothetical protein n=1 Tax=Mycobacterium sp. 1164966.3 TaxID=1856861 RepID=UPI0008012BBA|nr:hypothetical protein [Mycobacterium sp. 1164966.3]OBA80558.1 hypothetical protein A9W99_17230 [Mycobacterium sp. 1164966.3]